MTALLQRMRTFASQRAGRLTLASQPEQSPVGSPRPRFADVVAQSRLPGLDGLRAIGVLAVCFSHATLSHKLPGDFGPTAFFVLSGFLITRLLLREHKRTGGVSLRRFYLGRTLRIFPAYYAFLVISFVLDAHVGRGWSPAFLANALSYTINYFNAFNHHPTTSIAHAWSLAVEEQFYILWPLAFVILIARGRRSVITGVGLMAVAGVTWRSWLILGAHVDPSYVYNAFETRFDNLAVGCLLALVIDYPKFVAVAEWTVKRIWFSIVTLILLLASRVVLPNPYHYSIGFTIDSLLVAVLIVQVLQLYRSRLWRWLEWPAFRYLGAISYPMYLYHAWGGSLGRLLPGHSQVPEFLAGVVGTILLGSASYHFIELPLLRLKPRRVPDLSVNQIPEDPSHPAIGLARSA